MKRMKLEINLQSIQLKAKQKQNENNSFNTYLKSQDTNTIDAIVHKLNEKITPLIHCTDCGNCCHNLRPIATYKELSKFVEDKNIEEFKYLQGFSCKHLEDKRCNIYLERYEECKSFPYMDKTNFSGRTIGILQNYEICPIVFNIFESLKTELKWNFKA